MRCVPIRFLVIETSSKVLNRHQVLLSIVSNVEIQDVIGKVVDSSRKSGNLVSTRLGFPINLDSSLHRLAVFRKVASALSIGDARLGQTWFRRIRHGVAFRNGNEILDKHDFRGGTIQQHLNLSLLSILGTTPVFCSQSLSGIQFGIDARVILHHGGHVRSNLGLEHDFLVCFAQSVGDLTLDTTQQKVHGLLDFFNIGSSLFQTQLGLFVAASYDIRRLVLGTDLVVQEFNRKALVDGNDLVVVSGHDKVTIQTGLVVRQIAQSGFNRREFPNLEFVANERVERKISTVGNVRVGHQNSISSVGIHPVYFDTGTRRVHDFDPSRRAFVGGWSRRNQEDGKERQCDKTKGI
mmetsp:Transcript_2885/g.6797  ORF Transcript_2885/g.6797 Transcript_2885/m.6797 type:complete len:351 (+) Transcript_2885:1965-3017(+)